MIAFSGSLTRDITGFYRTRYLLPQVPSKKAKLKEGLLQIMDDERDCLNTYLVREPPFASEPYLVALLESKPCFTEGEPAAPAGQPAPGAGERQPGS